MYALDASHISKSYQSSRETVEVLQDVNLKMAKGEMVAIMGPSGSGKTTLLHVLTGIDVPDGGEVQIGGENLTGLTKEETAVFRRKHMGLIFQDFQLLESLTVKENILLPLILDKREADEQRQSVMEIMDALGIAGLAEKGMTELSGGQKQRTAIARALINEPEIIFGDEPTGSLDMKMTEDVMRCMVQMNRQFGTDFLLVTHDAYAASFCSRVLFLQNGNLALEIEKQGGNKGFQEEILRMLCHLGGGQDDIL